MRVLFLDIDDVLCLGRCFDVFDAWDGLHAEPERVFAEALHAPALTALRELVDGLDDLHIVISSSWRQSFDASDMRRLLTRLGAPFIVERLHPSQPHTPNLYDRLEDIRAWLQRHGQQLTAWAAIDDATSGPSLAVFRRTQPDHPDAGRLFLCDPRFGLTPALARQAREALLRPMGRMGPN